MEPNNNTTGTPQAYLTVLFFDERFNLVAVADGGIVQAQVRSTDAGNPNATALVLPLNTKAPKNGYAYIYLSNRSDQDVFFDNLTIGIAAGNIIEEDHYYAFGLKIAAISSKKLGDAGEGKLSNPYLYNDKEMLDENMNLNWYDLGFRNYDPQIGRFVQIDPLTNDYPELSPYQYAGNDPISNIDANGLDPVDVASFVKSLGEGVGDIATRFVTSGTAAGKWSVTWVQGGVAHCMLIKETEAATRSVGIGTVLKSALIAELSILKSAVKPDNNKHFEKGIFKGIGDWAMDIVKSGANEMLLKYHLIVNPKQTLSDINKALNLEMAKVLKKAYKISGGDLSDVNDKLVKFGNESDEEHGEIVGKASCNVAIIVFTGGAGAEEETVEEGSKILINGIQESMEVETAAEDGSVKYIGTLEDLKGIPRSQTFLDELPNLGTPKANYYQNMSVLRKALRNGFKIKDASKCRPNLELAPIPANPTRTIGQSFLGAERNLLNNRGLWP